MMQWDDTLWLFTVEELSQLPNGTEVVNILGKSAITGQDELDISTRYGMTAWGVRDPRSHDLAELFTFFQLKVNR